MDQGNESRRGTVFQEEDDGRAPTRAGGGKGERTDGRGAVRQDRVSWTCAKGRQERGGTKKGGGQQPVGCMSKRSSTQDPGEEVAGQRGTGVGRARAQRRVSVVSKAGCWLASLRGERGVNERRTSLLLNWPRHPEEGHARA